MKKNTGLAFLMAALLALAGCAVSDQRPSPAPSKAAGPALSASSADLDAAVDCSSTAANTDEEVVVLVPGSGIDPVTAFSWNWIPALDGAGRPYCTVALPGNSVGDVQLSSEYVVHAIRSAHALSGSQVAVVGWSQGGVNARFALKYWPDTHELVADYVGLAAPSHGSTQNDAMYPDGDGPAFILQLQTDSELIRELNAGEETFEGIDYTSISTVTDQFITPVGVTDLDGPSDRVANVSLQDICPESTADHFTIGTTDPVAFAVAMSAITEPGPADPAEIDPTVCEKAVMVGVDPLTVDEHLASVGDVADTSIAGAEILEEEPPLQSYVTG